MTPHFISLALPPGAGHAACVVGVEPDGAATAELTELCQLVISRRGRLERLRELRAPAIIVRNEWRMLCAAVKALIEHCQCAGIAPAVAAGCLAAAETPDDTQAE